MRGITMACGVMGVLLLAPLPESGPEALRAQAIPRATATRHLASVDRPARLRVENVSLAEALVELHQSSGVDLLFSPTLFPESHRVSCVCDSVTIGEALDQLLRGTAFHYFELAGQLVIARIPKRSLEVASPAALSLVPVARYDQTPGRLSTEEVRAVQDVVVAGTVVDTRSKGIVGARVTVDGRTNEAVTDDAGRFRLAGVTGNAVTLRVRAIGYIPLVQSVQVSSAPVILTMTEAAINLDEVVVTGTPGAVQKRAIGNAIATIDAVVVNTIAPASDISKLLTARAPGVMLQPASGGVGTGGRIRVRGITSLALTNEPLIYVDGVRLDNAVATGPPNLVGNRPYISRINDINPSDIDRVEIIKGPAAATLYGTEASNGVIQIITKKGATGKARIGVSTSQGANFLMDPEERFPVSYAREADGSIIQFSTVVNETERGTPSSAPVTDNNTGSMSPAVRTRSNTM